MLNVYQPFITEQDVSVTSRVLSSGWIGAGAEVAEFEATFAEHLGLGADHCVSTSSGTEALFLAVQALDLDHDDEVVLPAVSYVGAANAVLAAGARPVFTDVDVRKLNPTVEQIEARMGPRTRAVILLHYGGHPGHVREISRMCRDRGVWLIEDSACALGSSVDGRPCGTFGDIAMWSFDPVKVVTAGDGGMLAARDGDLAARLRQMTRMGLDRASGLHGSRTTDHRWWEFTVSEATRRSQMNDWQAALGRNQLSRLDEKADYRRSLVDRYDDGLSTHHTVTRPPRVPRGHRPNGYFYWIQLSTGDQRDSLASWLLSADVYTTFRYLPLHRQPLYGGGHSCPGADQAAEITLLLPLHEAVTPGDVDRVVDEVTRWEDAS